MVVARVGDVQEDVTQLRVERERSPCADWRAKRDHRFVSRRPIEWSTRKDVVLVPEIGTELLDLRCHLVDVRSGHAEATRRRRLDRDRLRWPVLVVGHSGSVDRLLGDLVQRFTCDAFEHVDEVELAGLQNGGNGTTVDLHVDQDRRRWHVPVGRVVMHQLVKPLQPAGLRIERDQRIAVQIAALDRTIRISGCAKYESRCFVRREVRPHVAAAAIFPTVTRPVFVMRLAGPRNRVERPDKLPGRCVPHSCGPVL